MNEVSFLGAILCCFVLLVEGQGASALATGLDMQMMTNTVSTSTTVHHHDSCFVRPQSMDSPSSAFVSAFGFANLPEDVGRTVFELLAGESTLEGLKSALVSKKVQSWFACTSAFFKDSSI
jgi:hypothetical protein